MNFEADFQRKNKFKAFSSLLKGSTLKQSTSNQFLIKNLSTLFDQNQI